MIVHRSNPRRCSWAGVPAGRHPRVYPGITSNYDDLTFAGHDSDARLLGIFDVSILHNIVHLLFGAAGLVGGANFVPVNWADNILHLALGGGMIVLGVVLGNEVAARRDTAAPAV